MAHEGRFRDAAAMCLAAGIWLEGVNFAIGSGEAAGLAALEQEGGLAGMGQQHGEYRR